MLSGDVIVSVNGVAVPATRESVPTIVSQIRDAGDSILRFEVRRGYEARCWPFPLPHLAPLPAPPAL